MPANDALREWEASIGNGDGEWTNADFEHAVALTANHRLTHAAFTAASARVLSSLDNPSAWGSQFYAYQSWKNYLSEQGHVLLGTRNIGDLVTRLEELDDRAQLDLLMSAAHYLQGASSMASALCNPVEAVCLEEMASYRTRPALLGDVGDSVAEGVQATGKHLRDLSPQQRLLQVLQPDGIMERFRSKWATFPFAPNPTFLRLWIDWLVVPHVPFSFVKITPSTPRKEAGASTPRIISVDIPGLDLPFLLARPEDPVWRNPSFRYLRGLQTSLKKLNLSLLDLIVKEIEAAVAHIKGEDSEGDIFILLACYNNDGLIGPVRPGDPDFERYTENNEALLDRLSRLQTGGRPLRILLQQPIDPTISLRRVSEEAKRLIQGKRRITLRHAMDTPPLLYTRKLRRDGEAVIQRILPETLDPDAREALRANRTLWVDGRLALEDPRRPGTTLPVYVMANETSGERYANFLFIDKFLRGRPCLERTFMNDAQMTAFRAQGQRIRDINRQLRDDFQAHTHSPVSLLIYDPNPDFERVGNLIDLVHFLSGDGLHLNAFGYFMLNLFRLRFLFAGGKTSEEKPAFRLSVDEICAQIPEGLDTAEVTYHILRFIQTGSDDALEPICSAVEALCKTRHYRVKAGRNSVNFIMKQVSVTERPGYGRRTITSGHRPREGEAPGRALPDLEGATRAPTHR